MDSLNEEKDKEKNEPSGGLYKNIKITKKEIDITVILLFVVIFIGLVIWAIIS